MRISDWISDVCSSDLSGMVFSDGSYNNIHDWAQVYIAPYGWVPMDVTTGRLPADKGTGNDPAMEWFYLGGLDNWRIAFNQDWDRAFPQIGRASSRERVCKYVVILGGAVTIKKKTTK